MTRSIKKADLVLLGQGICQHHPEISYSGKKRYDTNHDIARMTTEEKGQKNTHKKTNYL
jgi:hypothetical protein